MQWGANGGQRGPCPQLRRQLNASDSTACAAECEHVTCGLLACECKSAGMMLHCGHVLAIAFKI